MAGAMKATKDITANTTKGITAKAITVNATKVITVSTTKGTIMGVIIIIMVQNIIGCRRAIPISGMAGWIIIIGMVHIIQKGIRNT